MTSSYKYRDSESVVQFVRRLLNQEDADLLLTVTITPKLLEGFYVVDVTADFDSTSPPNGCEKPPTI